METHNLSDYDRSLIESLTAAIGRLEVALVGQREERLYSCKEAAQYLGKTPQTISRYIRQGRLGKAVRGGVVGVPESELKKIRNITP